MHLILILFILPLSLWYLIKEFYRKKYNYWKERGVTCINPAIPFGNVQSLFNMKMSISLHLGTLYNEFKTKKLPVGGIYVGQFPCIIVIDPKVIRKVCTEDFQCFVDRGLLNDEINETLTVNLFVLKGQEWKNLRAKLSPTFATGNLRLMIKPMLECADAMIQSMKSLERTTLDAKDVVACFTTDVVTSVAFGLESDRVKENAQLRFYGKKVFANTYTALIRQVFVQYFPGFSRKLGLTFFGKEVNDFFLKSMRDIVNCREENIVNNHDLLQLLLSLKNKGTDNQCLSMDQLSGHAFLFFLSGFETVSTAIQFSLYELAKQEDIQEKARSEVLGLLEESDSEIMYEKLSKMTYLNQIIEETLRKYSPIPEIRRESVKEYHLPEYNLTFERGTNILISLFGLHYDEEYYPNPHRFDPERFNEENRNKIPPYTFLPFGSGPRVCIAMRYAMMQMKLCLALILKHFKLTVSDETVQPVTFSKYNVVLKSEHPIYLNIQQI